MNVAVIGADRPWGALLATELGARFCRARRPGGACLCLYAVSARRGVARRIWARRTSLFDVVGGVVCAAFRSG